MYIFIIMYDFITYNLHNIHIPKNGSVKYKLVELEYICIRKKTLFIYL